MEKKICVGFFDSGVGGLTVLHACAAVRWARFFYYGDNGNAPYGNRPEEEIACLVRRGVDELLRAGAEVIVLACNTATAVCAEALRGVLSVPVIGMEPAVKVAAEHCRRALILATACTAQSRRLQNLVARFPQCDFTVHAAEGLAAEVERCLAEGGAPPLASLPRGHFDGVVLGCTHYVFYRREISAHYGAPVFDGNEGTARRLEAVLCAMRVERGWSENTKTNKSLYCEWSEERPFQVQFIGKWGAHNEKIYKQTFESRFRP